MINFKDRFKKKEKDEFRTKLIQHRLVILYRTVLAIVAVVVICLVVYMNYENMVYTGYDIVSESERNDAENATYVANNGKILKYSQDGAEVFDGENTGLWNVTYEMQNPVVATCQEYVAIGDYKGNKIFVMNGAGEQGEIETKLPITNFCISGQGVVAAVMEDTSATRINVYSKEGEELLTIKCTMSQSGYPIDLSLSEDGIKLAVSYMRIENGQLVSSVAFYNFGEVGQNETDRFTGGYDYIDAVVPKVKFINNSTAFALSNGRFILYKGNQKPVSHYEALLSDEVQSVFYGDKSVGMVFRTGNAENKYRIDVYDETGNLSLSQTFNMDYTDIILRDDLVIIYDDSQCEIYNLKGVKKFEGKFEDPALLLVPTESKTKYILVNRDNTQIIKLK